MKKLSVIFVACFLSIAADIQAQYFGRNKPRYRSFDFKVTQSHHFDIHHYTTNKTAIQRFANETEQWYQMHRSVLGENFLSRNPLILYNDHAGFQQTNTIQGDISVGTGGVTEGLRNRVIMPYAASNQQTNHVLGHELVHAFQYHLLIHGDSTSLRNIQNLPLWMVEGLAEYMSIGKYDAHTAMWLRDAILNNDIPDFKKLSVDPRYFPYRWGQAFWAFMTGKYGDQIIRPLFVSTARNGYELAMIEQTGRTAKDLSAEWKSTIESYYKTFMGSRKEKPTGRSLINEKKGGGRINISPVLSPNGKYVIFLSEKNLFSTDLFLADAKTGEILRGVFSSAKASHLDDLNYIESAGSWSPDSREFAFVGVAKGRNVLIVKDVLTGKTTFEGAIPDVPAFYNPAWSPVSGSRKIVVSGLVEGQVDLYEFDLKTKKTRQITNDIYSEMLPSWSADGSQLVFSTDRLSMERGRYNGKWTSNLATLEVATGSVTHHEVFLNADNLNPVFDGNETIFFLSDRDGFRNIYKYEITTKKLFQITDLLTGVTGITKFAPAISVERSAGNKLRLAYTHYFNQRYNIYQAFEDDFLNKEVAADDVNMAAAMLPPVFGESAQNVVNLNLATQRAIPDTAFTKEKPYQSKFKLDYVGSSGGIGVGIGRSSGFGTTGLGAGSVDMLFGDMLGNNQLYAGLRMQGDILDAGGQVSYINNKNKLGWGFYGTHTSFLFGDYKYDGIRNIRISNTQSIKAEKYTVFQQRMFQSGVGGLAFIPFSVTKRWEFNADYSRYYFRTDSIGLYYDGFGQQIAEDRGRIRNNTPGFNVMTIGTAFVGDNSYFGVASPLSGWRYRVGAEQYFGAFPLFATTLDLRGYHRMRPFTLAGRLMQINRFVQDQSIRNALIFLGNPFFLHGFAPSNMERIFGANYAQVFERMVGTKFLLSNVELRLPFTGPARLSLIKSNFLLTELNLFADAGMIWTGFDSFKGTSFKTWTDYSSSDVNRFRPILVSSVGASMRINLFGYLILEPYLAKALVKDAPFRFGFNFLQVGW